MVPWEKGLPVPLSLQSHFAPKTLRQRPDGCSRPSSRALPEPHVATNLLLGLAVRLLQSPLQLLLIGRFVDLAQTGQQGKIAIDLLNRCLAVVCLFDGGIGHRLSSL